MLSKLLLARSIANHATPSNDPYWGSVVSLLPFDGGVPFADDSTSSIWSSGNGALTSAMHSKFGGRALALNGTNYIFSSSPAVVAVGGGDYTIEGEVYFNTVSKIQTIYAEWASSTVTPGRLLVNSNNSLQWYDSSLNLNTSGGLIASNTWYHVAVSKVGTTVRVFLNGNIVATGTSSVATAGTYAVELGRNLQNNAWNIDGYVDEFRVTKGVGRYTSAFTPPIAQYPNTLAGDVYWASVVFLAHFDGAQEGQIAPDQKGLLWSITGLPSVSTTQHKFGAASYFGASGAYISADIGTAGTGNFCYEGWVYPTSTSTRGIFHLYSTAGGAGSAAGLALGYNNATQKIQLYHNGVTDDGTVALIVNTWSAWCVERVGTTITVYINGAVALTVTEVMDLSPYTIMSIGIYFTSAYPTIGYLDEIRLTNGAARYNGPYAPSVVAFPNS